MKQFLSEILKFAELEFSYVERELIATLKSLVRSCDDGGYVEHGAVDSGYVVHRVGHIDVLIQVVVGVGDRVKERHIVQRVVGDVHVQARRNELNFAESLGVDLVLIDGPLTPYTYGGDRIVGVSKDPRLARYGEKIHRRDVRDQFLKISRLVGERKLAELLLLDSPSGSFLEPVDMGSLYGTFFKSDWVLYVEFPKKYKAEELCGVFKRYPVKLRLAHRLAKMGKSYLNLVRYFLPDSYLPPRDLL